MARNERLADAISASGKRPEEIADEIGVDAKSVARWIAGSNAPRQLYRQRVAEALEVPIPVLWPDVGGVAHGIAELAGVYATRHEVSPASVGAMLDSVEERVDLLDDPSLTWLVLACSEVPSHPY